MTFGAPVIPSCPQSCCFREICSTAIQRQVSLLIATGQLRTREGCRWFELLAETHRKETSCEPPASSAELTEQLARIGHRRITRDAA